MGAPYPGPEPPVPANDVTSSTAPASEETSFWAFQPMGDPEPPTVDAPEPLSPIDRFLYAKLETSGLKPAPPADKLTLLRRTTYDLTGLPPTEDEIRSFLEDVAERLGAIAVGARLPS